MDVREFVDTTELMDARELMDAGMYREAEDAFNGGRVVFSNTAPEYTRNFVQCDECGTWYNEVFTECPFCFSK